MAYLGRAAASEGSLVSRSYRSISVGLAVCCTGDRCCGSLAASNQRAHRPSLARLRACPLSYGRLPPPCRSERPSSLCPAEAVSTGAHISSSIRFPLCHTYQLDMLVVKCGELHAPFGSLLRGPLIKLNLALLQPYCPFPFQAQTLLALLLLPQSDPLNLLLVLALFNLDLGCTWL